LDTVSIGGVPLPLLDLQQPTWVLKGGEIQ